MAKLDPYKHKESYLKWKKKVARGISEISKANSGLIFQFLRDMELGLNIGNGSKKGPRSYIRLNSSKYRLIFFARKFKELFALEKMTSITEEQLHQFFADMRAGNFKKANGETFINKKFLL
jgi:mRNA-degrading endonuclease RelE of RelBE toxin-antitoxin system